MWTKEIACAKSGDLRKSSALLLGAQLWSQTWDIYNLVPQLPLLGHVYAFLEPLFPDL